MHLKAKFAKVSKNLVGARDEVSTRVEEERAVVRKEIGPELKGRGVPFAGRVFAHGYAAFAGHELRPRHAAGPLQRLHRRLWERGEKGCDSLQIQARVRALCGV